MAVWYAHSDTPAATDVLSPVAADNNIFAWCDCTAQLNHDGIHTQQAAI
jgi:hypothetical protein